MHSKGQLPSFPFCAVSLAMIAALMMAVSIVPAWAQNSVSPTARQAATMPQFASRLAHPARPAWPQASSRSYPAPPKASLKNPGAQRARGQDGWLPNDVFYDNGPINGTTDAWTINFGFSVSDSFTCAGGCSVQDLHIGVWLFPGDNLGSLELQLGSTPFGNDYGDVVTNASGHTDLGINQYGYDIQRVDFSFSDIAVPSGTSWVTLSNAVETQFGDPVYWDENSGPSSAYENSVGSIPSEAFTVEGSTHYPPPPECAHDKPEDGFKLIHNFTGSEQSPTPGLAIDQGGKLYGATPGGDHGLGLAYQLAGHGLDWIFTPLYSFLGGVNGQNPSPENIGPGGALYGIADGGIQNCGSSGTDYCGVVYRLRPSPFACLTVPCGWIEDVIYRFTGPPDGWAPIGNPVFDQVGNLYGATLLGGAYGYGTIYELKPSNNGGWTEKVIYSFTGGHPTSVLLGHDGNLYGTIANSIFQLTLSGGSWTLRVLATITRGDDLESLVQDSAGSLYVLQSFRCLETDIEAAIYKLSYGDWGVTVLEDTSDYGCRCSYHDCYVVYYNLAVDSTDRVYVTWGERTCYGECYYYGGNVHRVPFDQYHDVPISFGGDVFRDLQITPGGKFYGTTGACGSSEGTVWQLTPQH